MNEYHFPIVCGRCDNGGLVLCMNSCMYAIIYISVYVCWCAACIGLCVYVWRMTLSMWKRKQNSWFVVRKYLLLTGKLDFYLGYKFYRCSCLICLIRSYGTDAILNISSQNSLTVNSVSVTTPAKNYVPPLEFGGLNPSFFVIWGA